MKRIAIIGSGISGLGASYALKDVADITVYEANDRAGGHAHTIDVDYDGQSIGVDVGFIVYINKPVFVLNSVCVHFLRHMPVYQGVLLTP